jgi:hypothetical protein
MADSIKASPVTSPRMLALAELLQKGKDFANKAQIPGAVPLIGGMGIGDLVVGRSPEEFTNWAYGNAPMRVPEMSSVPVMKTGRKEPLADAIGMLPVGPHGAGVAGQAMITPGGDPRLLLSRSTDWWQLVNRKRGLDKKIIEEGVANSIDHPSFGIQYNGFPSFAGKNFLLPHPRAVDPKYNLENELYNLDAYTGGKHSFERGSKRFGFPDGSSGEPEYDLRIAMSPKFTSLKNFANSKHGALKGIFDSDMGKGVYNSGAFNRVMNALDEADPEWRYDIDKPDMEKFYVRVIKDHPELAKDISAIRRSSGIGQDHAELKVEGKLPINNTTIQALIHKKPDKFDTPDDIARQKRVIDEYKRRGIMTHEYDDDDEAIQWAKKIQQSAKF